MKKKNNLKTFFFNYIYSLEFLFNLIKKFFIFNNFFILFTKNNILIYEMLFFYLFRILNLQILLLNKKLIF